MGNEMVKNNIVSVDWTFAHLNDPLVVIVDCRFALGQPNAGREQYDSGHIPGARYFDLERELSAPVGAHGGRHPLPDIGAFAQMLGRAGIGRDTHVVAYDDQGGMYASRLWWLLRYVGHPGGVSVLDGGFSAWRAAGHAVTTEAPAAAEPRDYAPEVQPQLVASMSDVRARLGADGVMLIDSREAPRYRGEVEPIDPVAGHIPSAVNLFWKDSLTAEGRFRSADEQRSRFAESPAAAKLNAADEIIVYCGSGVSACPNVLALAEAGYANVKLYSGSWSDWIIRLRRGKSKKR